MTKIRQTKVVREGFGYLEGFRWHNNEVWFSDIPTGKVYRIKPDGSEQHVAASLDVKPSGLGFPPGKEPLVVGQTDNTLRRILPDGSTEVVADLSGKAIGANDMWVDSQGRAFITQIGFDLFGETPKPSHMIIVQPDGTVETGDHELVCPNGVQLTADEKTLIVSETFGFRLSAFNVDEKGKLSNYRVIKQYENDLLNAVDGLVIDEEDATWVAVPFRGEIHRITPDGTVTDIVQTATKGHFAITCTLGGPEGRHLYLTATDTNGSMELESLFKGTSRVEGVEVDIPGVVK